MPRTNLVPNPSFEVDTTGWIVWRGGDTIARSTAQAFAGSASCSVTRGAAASTSQIGIIMDSAGGHRVTGLTGGQTYTISAYVRPGSTARRAQIGAVTWTSDDGINWGTVAGGSYVNEVAGQWVRVSHTLTAPAQATRMVFSVLVNDAAGASMPIGEAHYFDAIMVEQGAALGSYFDDRLLAQQAKEMVDRCRTVLIDRYGKYSTGQPVEPAQLAPHADYVNTKGEGIGWANVLAADAASADFSFWASLHPQVVLKSNTDGRLYKVLIDPADTRYATEKALFDSMKAEGKTWVPEYTPYDEHKVMAIKEYELLYTLGQRYSSTAHPLAASPDVAAYRGTAECREMDAAKVNYGIGQLGLDANGRPVLLSGCVGARS